MANHQKTYPSRPGFTLVEVIVVLVILAILAALLIPAMTGWIDKAEEKSILVEARSVLLAAQTLYSEAYANDKEDFWQMVTTSAIRQLAGADGQPGIYTWDTNAQITKFTYEKDGKTATYENGVWTVS